MPCFKAGDHIGKAAMNTKIIGQLLQTASGPLLIVSNLPIRSPRLLRARSRRGGQFHKLREL
jgi:hypothetical protein